MSRCLKDIRKKNIKIWKNRVLKLLQILSSIQSSQSTTDTIHVKDLELILNGLGFFPGDIHLDEMSFEIRFRDRYSLSQNFTTRWQSQRIQLNLRHSNQTAVSF